MINWCYFGIHKWNKWSERFVFTIHHYWGEKYTGDETQQRQERFCQRCGKYSYRKVK